MHLVMVLPRDIRNSMRSNQACLSIAMTPAPQRTTRVTLAGGAGVKGAPQTVAENVPSLALPSCRSCCCSAL